MELVQQKHTFFLNMTVEEALIFQSELAKSISHALNYNHSSHSTHIIFSQEQELTMGTSIAFNVSKD